MQLSIPSAYAGGIAIGQRKLYAFNASGPSSYSQTTGDAVVPPINEYVDAMPPCMTVSKNYQVWFYPSAVGTTRASWVAKWYTTAGAEVGNGVNLSAENIQSFFIGGEF